MSTTKQAVISLETAKEAYKSGSNLLVKFALGNFTKEELEEVELPNKWEDLDYIKGFYVDSMSIIKPYSQPTSNAGKNTFPTKEYAEAALALSQLLQLRQVYIGDWVPDYKSEGYTVYSIYVYKCKLDTGVFVNTQHILSFPTSELRDKFYNSFKDLLEIAKPLL